MIRITCLFATLRGGHAARAGSVCPCMRRSSFIHDDRFCAILTGFFYMYGSRAFFCPPKCLCAQELMAGTIAPIPLPLFSYTPS